MMESGLLHLKSMEVKLRNIRNHLVLLLIFIVSLGCAGGDGGKNDGAEVILQDWIKEADNPVFFSEAGQWDGNNITHISVLFEDVYMMWYTGVAPDFQRRIGYAASSDGIEWSRYEGNNCPTISGGYGCVLEKAHSTAWDGGSVFIGSVLIDINDSPDKRFKMWYSAVDNKTSDEDKRWRIGYAASPDGIEWTRYEGNNCSTSPDGDGCVLDVGDPGNWDDAVSGTPVVKIDQDALPGKRYKMWYEGCIYVGTPIHVCRIGYATSPDGIEWTRHKGNNCPTNPDGDGCIFDVADNMDWDSFSVFEPTVLKTLTGQYEMWYSAMDNKTSDEDKRWRIGYAASPDGIEWTRHKGNNCPTNPDGDGCVLDVGDPGNWDDFMIKAPGVIKITDRYLMWYVGKGDSSGKIGLAYLNK